MNTTSGYKQLREIRSRIPWDENDDVKWKRTNTVLNLHQINQNELKVARGWRGKSRAECQTFSHQALCSMSEGGGGGMMTKGWQNWTKDEQI